MTETIPFCGYNLIFTTAYRYTVRARIHRKKRIDKKWLKRYGYVERPANTFTVCDGNIYIHPKYKDKILPILEEKYGRENIKT